VTSSVTTEKPLSVFLGHAAMISAGEFVQASGSRINDRTHGVQFRASFLKATTPTTVEGIEKYLGSGTPGEHSRKRAVVERKLDGDKTYVLWFMWCRLDAE
jgi:hypothetical protein